MKFLFRGERKYIRQWLRAKSNKKSKFLIGEKVIKMTIFSPAFQTKVEDQFI